MKSLKDKELLAIITIYLFVTIHLSISNNVIYKNIINPIFWGCMLIYVLWNIKKYYIRVRKNKKYLIYMLVISSIHVIIYFYLGFVYGFLKNPYTQDIFSFARILIIQVVQAVSIEIARFIIISRNKNNKFLFVYLTILLMLIEVDYYTLYNMVSNKRSLFEYVCSKIFPLISTNLLYTYLALKGSYSFALIYRLYREIIRIILPILPDIDWLNEGAEGVLSPAIVYFLFRYKIIKENKDIRKKQSTNFQKISYLVTFTICIILVCFMLGAFKYEPITILSNSMNPLFSRGDVLIYEKLEESKLKEIPKDSIIIYKVGEQNIAHRVVNIVKERDKVFYQTKGDNNKVADTKLVSTDQIIGIYIFHIKYIGFPSVWLNDYLRRE